MASTGEPEFIPLHLRFRDIPGNLCFCAALCSALSDMTRMISAQMTTEDAAVFEHLVELTEMHCNSLTLTALQRLLDDHLLFGPHETRARLFTPAFKALVLEFLPGAR